MAQISFFKSTIGRKQLVGITGLALSGFLLSHVLGNFLIFLGPEVYNKYSYALVSNPLLYLAEVGLLLIFLGHLFLATIVNFKNRNARPVKYAMAATGDKETSNVTKSMWYQGIIIAVFLVLHILTFKLGTFYEVTYGGVQMRDLHKLIVEVFRDPVYVVGYIMCLLVLGMHLSHGLQSSIRTLGFNHPKYEPKIAWLSYFFAAFIAFGFISQPLYVYFLY